MAIVVQESLRGLFYAPFYAALARGAYEQEGVEVRFASAPSPGQAPQTLFDGTVDVAWGGPMRVNQLYAERADCDLVCFGEAVTRDPFLLVGRALCPNFTFADLMTSRVATVSGVPTPSVRPQPLLRAAVTRYRGLGIWGPSPILPQDGYDRLAAGLVSGGFIGSAAPFDTAVDNSLAEQAVREDPPSL